MYHKTNYKISSASLINLSLTFSVIYAFFPLVRALPLYIRVILRIIPFAMTAVAIVIKREKKLYNVFCATVICAAAIAIIRFYTNANGVERDTTCVVFICNSILYWTPVMQSAYIINNPDKIKVKSIIRKMCMLITISSLTTCIGNFIVPGVSRTMTNETQSIYYLFNIGSYGFVYGVALTIPCWIYLIDNARLYLKVKQGKILWFSTIIIISAMLIFAEYMTALVLGVIGLTYYFFRNKSMRQFMHIFKRIIIATVVLLPLIPFLTEAVLQFLSKMGFEMLYERVHGILLLFTQGETYGDVFQRVTLYTLSFTCFIENPIFGLIGINGFTPTKIKPEWVLNGNVQKQFVIGRHSDLIDLLGGGGMLGMFFFVFIIFKYIKRVFSFFKCDNQRLLCVFTLIIYIIYGIFDHSLSNFEVAFSAFVFPTLVYVGSKEYICRGEK